jgi:hypothetical protein
MGDEMERWKKLDVWRLADELAQQVYQVTRRFPKEELYGITSQSAEGSCFCGDQHRRRLLPAW